MKKNLITVAELERRAMNRLNNYEGQPASNNPYELGRNFQGMQARAIAPTPTSFTLTVTNSSQADKSVALLPAYFDVASKVKNASGTAVDAIIKEGVVIGTAQAPEVSAVGKPKSIDEFLAFVRYNPVRITGLKMKVDNTDQFSEDILLRKESPFKDLGFVTKSPANYENSLANNDKIVEIPLTDAQFDNQTSVVTTIKAGRTVTYTFYIGAISNEAAVLDQTVKMAGLSR